MSEEHPIISMPFKRVDEYVMCKPEYLAKKNQRIAALEGALKPFAKAGELFKKNPSPPCVDPYIYAPAAGPDYQILASDLLRAYDALTGTGGEVWRHKKRGNEYTVIATGKVQTETGLADMADVTIYRGDGGDIWARATAEFYDGRFERVAPPAQTDKRDYTDGRPIGTVSVPYGFSSVNPDFTGSKDDMLLGDVEALGQTDEGERG